MEFTETLPIVLPLGALVLWLILVFVLLRYAKSIGPFFKVVGWLVAIAAVVAPIYVFSQLLSDNIARMEAPMAEVGGEPADGDTARTRSASRGIETGTRARTEPLAKRSAPKAKLAKRSAKPLGTRSAGQGPKIGGLSTDEAQPAADEPMAEMAAPQPEAVAEAPAATAAPKDEPFDTVGVYFGTDRQRNDSEQNGVMRVAFGADRGRKLSLGRADVTIPREAHDPGVVERPWQITVIGITIYREKEDPKKHFTIRKIGLMSEDEFFASVNTQLAKSKRYEGHALVFVHGYNVAFDAALYRTAQITYDLDFDGVPFLYSWPSRGEFASYENDQNSSEQAERYLESFLNMIVERSNARHINLIAHSMGNKPLLRVLQKMQVAAEVQSDLRINQIVLAAPDVDRHVFEDIAQEISAFSKGVTLYASSNDRAMKASRAYAGEVRAGDISEQGPLIVNGVDTIDVSAISMAILALNHSTYAEKSELLKDIGRLMLTGLRPPKQRSPAFQKIETQAGTYWRFPLAN